MPFWIVFLIVSSTLFGVLILEARHAVRRENEQRRAEVRHRLLLDGTAIPKAYRRD